MLQIYRPTLSKRLTQGWGENRACIRGDGKIIGTDTYCPEGTQSFYESIGMLGHNGIDIAEFKGANVHHSASFDGWMKTEKDMSGGIGVDVISNERLFFEGEPEDDMKDLVERGEEFGKEGFYSYVKMRYWHLQAPVGYDGKEVVLGDTIGLSGNTGASSGPHLHFAPKWCDKNGNNISPNNGFYGAFDPTPYYKHLIFAFEQGKMELGEDPELTEAEKREILDQLSIIQTILLSIRKLISLL